MKYIVGSDKKTAQIAAETVARVNAAMDSGNWQEAERIIETAMQSPNQPFIAEFSAQSKTCAS